ncbi:MAG: methyltransferase domain-containing protein, partial [Anaerolineales bacterium]
AVLVMHSWSLLNFNRATGYYDSPNADYLEKFSAVLEMLSHHYKLITITDLAEVEGVNVDRMVRYRRNIFYLEDDGRVGQITCEVCGANIERFEDYNGTRRKCGVCGGLERQRALAALLKSDLLQADVRGKRILLISPSRSELKIFSAIANAQITTLDIRKELKTDIVADLCNMPEVPSRSFDIIAASHVLVSVHDLKAALSEISRVLADDGLFISYEPCADNTMSSELTDIEQITHHYGKELYDKYRIGRFRNLGNLDLDKLFEPYFERDAYHFLDLPTQSRHEVNIWKKNSVRTINLRISACPVCGDALVEVESGQNCMKCGSRARLRSIAPLIQEYLAPLLRGNTVVDLPLLAFAMTAAERKFISMVFNNIKSVSLFGNYSNDHESGVDMRDLSRYPQDGFSGVFGCLLFDYFLEHEQALRECYRVIAPGGVFFTHIAPYRIVDGDMPPQQKGSIKCRPGYFDYLPENTQLPDVKVGRDWFLAALRRTGFEPVLVRVKDGVPGIVSEWFIGIKAGGAKKLSQSKPSSSIPAPTPQTVIATKISEVFRSVIPLDNSDLGMLRIELIEAVRGSLVFLEDHYSSAPDGGGSLRE